MIKVVLNHPQQYVMHNLADPRKIITFDVDNRCVGIVVFLKSHEGGSCYIQWADGDAHPSFDSLELLIRHYNKLTFYQV